MNEIAAQKESSMDALVGQVADEFIERLDKGEQPDIEEYVRRHPHLALVLRDVLTALQVMRVPGQLAASDGDGAQPSPPLVGVLGDFRMIREVGRGGMGVVYEAEQMSLDRRVALKVLPFAATMDPRQLQRFQNEARAAAGLHHTNIVPVYGVGCERGIHFYAMQYIEGQSLADVIASLKASVGRQTHDATTPYHGADAPRSPETVPIARISTAHSTKDPSYFRTVAQLGIQAAEALDYAHQMGVIHRDVKPANLLIDNSPLTTHHSPRLWVTDFGLAQVHSDTRLTMTGDLVGTLRYMSPEQALAKRVVVDHRTDIYSLGATLYELLTLQPAYRGSDRQELLRQIAFEEPKAPRRVSKAIPAELDTIVLKAMEKNPAERYGTAQELAVDLRNFLESRPLRARRPGAVLRLRKWARRHQAPVTTAIICLFLAIAALTAVAGWVLRDRRARRGDDERTAGNALTEADRLHEEGKWAEAISAADRAEELLARGDNLDLLQRARDLRKDLVMGKRLEGIRLLRGEVNEKDIDHVHIDETGVDSEYEQAFRDYGIDIARLDIQEAAERLRATGMRLELAAALEDWSWNRRLWRTKDDTTWKNLLDLARAADPDEWRNRLRDAWEQGDKKLLVELAHSERAADLPPATLLVLATTLRHSGAMQGAADLLRRAQRSHPNDFWINHGLAGVIVRMNPPRLDEAIRYYYVAQALRPDEFSVYFNLGIYLKENGERDAAIAACRKAVHLKPNFAPAHNQLGNALQSKGNLDEAIVAHRAAIRLRPDFALAHNNLGLALLAKGRHDGAIAAFRDAIDAFRKAIGLNKNYVEAYVGLGSALRAIGQHDEAITTYRDAIRVKPGYALAHFNLATALNAKGQRQAAIAAMRDATLADPNYAQAHWELGLLCKEENQLNDAIQAFRNAVRAKPDYAKAYCELGQALGNTNQLLDAIVAYRHALRVRPNYVDALNGLGITLQMLGHGDRAIAVFRDATLAKPEKAGSYHNLGTALAMSGRPEEAINAFRAAIRIDSRLAGTHSSLALVLYDMGKFGEAWTEHQTALQQNPDDPLICNNAAAFLADCPDVSSARGPAMAPEALLCRATARLSWSAGPISRRPAPSSQLHGTRPAAVWTRVSAATGS
jgi:tetratricopeptide (TPR) repeat protein